MEIKKEEKEKLKIFESFVKKWQKGVNLVSSNSLSDIWNRHIIDSCQLFPYIEKGVVLDVGSGGGFPGIVLAILCRKKDNKFYFVERDKRKCAFLREMIRFFDLNAEVISESIEDIKSFRIDIITARAFADLEKILTLVKKFIKNDTKVYLLKGRKADIEISKARESYSFDVVKIPSITNNEGSILKITNIIIL